MGMTTLLTLASMFGSLTSITPPISYYTKLDIWMISCMVFVFLTLAEFTLVIILKYYLPHLPLDCFHKLCLKARTVPPSLASSINQKDQKATKEALARTKAWVSTDSNVRLRPVATIHDYSHKHKDALNGKQVMEKDTAELFDDDETAIYKANCRSTVHLIDAYQIFQSSHVKLAQNLTYNNIVIWNV